MKPIPAYSGEDRRFWAYVKLLSENLGYALRGKDAMRRFSAPEAIAALKKMNLSAVHLEDKGGPTHYAEKIVAYLNTRAELIETAVRPALMTREQAKEVFAQLRGEINPKCTLALNKQKGEKRHEAYMTCIVNMLTERALGGVHFDDNPRGLVSLTVDGAPIRTLTRWMDGAYPQIRDPIAVWEVKEYYGTTTFGSRVADGVYETMLDGEELREANIGAGRHVLHYLIVDDMFTWWVKGKSYLCRILDMTNMGLVDEVLFGRETILEWPRIVASWPAPRKPS